MLESRAADSYKALFDSILVEAISFLDVNNLRYCGSSLWLDACKNASESFRSILQRLVDVGCNVAEKDDKHGRNCLFHAVFGSFRPKNSDEFEKLQYLLGVFDDIYATDAWGRTVFDHVGTAELEYMGSYHRDLWYCALDRAGIDVSDHLAKHPRVPLYRTNQFREYTPEHYHALKHLQSWDEDNFRSQMDLLLQEIPLEEDEALEMERLRKERGDGTEFYDTDDERR